jgi:phytoene desaturase
MHTSKAIVIGSGVAGIAAAIRLAVNGYAVTVYEKNTYPGGKLSAFQKEGYSFDAGPSLFTQPSNLEELFALAGEPIEQYFSYQPINPACRYFYENGKVVNAYTDTEAFAGEAAEKLGENPDSIRNYLRDADRLYNQTGNIFLNYSLHKRKTWLHRSVLKAVRATSWGYLFNSLHKHNEKRFTTPEAIQLFDRFATYNGSNPYKAPGMLSLIPHLEQNEGTFYPKGGMISITNALYQLALKKGVEFCFDTPVNRIIHHEGKVRGIVVNDQNIGADLVVSNMDAFLTQGHLLRNPFEAKKILKQERSSSAVIFYWGVAREFDRLHLHNIFFSADYKKEFECLFQKKVLTDDPTIYVNITAKIEPGQAPTGKENWFVMINAPANVGQDWPSLVANARKAVLAKLNRLLDTNLESLIETETILDPVGIEAATFSYQGSLYGTNSNARLAAFFRTPNFSNRIKGLYFCGGSVHPGGGIPLCLKSARIVSELAGKPKTKHH